MRPIDFKQTFRYYIGMTRLVKNNIDKIYKFLSLFTGKSKKRVRQVFNAEAVYIDDVYDTRSIKLLGLVIIFPTLDLFLHRVRANYNFIRLLIPLTLFYFSKNKLQILISARDEIRDINQGDRTAKKDYRYLNVHKKKFKSIIELVDKDLPKFIETYLPNNQALTRFYKGFYRYEEDVDAGFIFYSLLIPKKNEIPLDMLKSILINNRFDDHNGYLMADYRHCWIINNLETVHRMFDSYTPEALKTFFTRKYDADVFADKIYTLAKTHNFGTDKVLPVFKSYSEFSEFSSTVINNRLGKEAGILNNQQLGPYTLIALHEVTIMHEWGRSMHNCLKTGNSYYSNDSIYGIMKNNKKVGIVRLSGSFGIEEIKGKFNSIFEDELEFSKYLREFRHSSEEND